MTTPEGIVEDYFVKRVRETGGMVRKLKWIGFNGAPDRIVWWPPQHHALTADIFFVELKAPGEKPNKQQTEEHKKMKENGLRVLVIDTKEKVDEFVNAPMFYRGHVFL